MLLTKESTLAITYTSNALKHCCIYIEIS